MLDHLIESHIKARDENGFGHLDVPRELHSDQRREFVNSQRNGKNHKGLRTTVISTCMRNFQRQTDVLETQFSHP